jgi:hypothetical protein
MDFGSLEELYKTDEKLVNEGAPITVGMNDKNDPIIMYVAEAGNKKHRASQRKHDKAIEVARHNEKRRRYLTNKVICEGILIGWSGVLDSKGKEVKFTIENAIEALTKYDKLSFAIMDSAMDIENYRPPEIVGDTEKNLGKS